MNILVTGVGGDIGQSIVKCLKEAFPEAKLFGCDIDLYPAGKAMVDIFEQAPNAIDADEYCSFLHKVVTSNKIQYIYPSTEKEIVWFHKNRACLSGVTVFINKPFIVETFFDKYKTVQFLKSCGVLYPATYLIEDFDNQIKYPLLIKQRRSWGSRGLIEVHDADEFEYYRMRTPNSIVQEILGTVDEEYTVGVFSDGKDVHSICFRRYLGYGSMSKFVELSYSDEVKETVEVIAKSCGLVGSINVQLRKTDRGYIPFEVNPRISSTVYFRHCFGFEDVKWWMDIKEYRPIKYQLKYQEGIGVRVIGEVFFGVK